MAKYKASRNIDKEVETLRQKLKEQQNESAQLKAILNEKQSQVIKLQEENKIALTKIKELQPLKSNPQSDEQRSFSKIFEAMENETQELKKSTDNILKTIRATLKFAEEGLDDILEKYTRKVSKEKEDMFFELSVNTKPQTMKSVCKNCLKVFVIIIS